MGLLPDKLTISIKSIADLAQHIEQCAEQERRRSLRVRSERARSNAQARQSAFLECAFLLRHAEFAKEEGAIHDAG